MLPPPVSKAIETKSSGIPFSLPTLLIGIVLFVVLLAVEYSLAAQSDYWSELYSWSQFTWFVWASIMYLAGVVLLAFSVGAFFIARASLLRRLVSIPALALIVLGGFYVHTFLSVLAFKLRT
ncbi:MAG: hypothetical protein QOE70_4742 [Chthoniobacter sp.]|jgi:hypothetical protein|nr:hypothetical protein [Chthoniobacter sp.]